MKPSEIKALMEGIAPVLQKYVHEEIQKTLARPSASSDHPLDELTDAIKGYIDRGFATVIERLEALEARPTMKYRGVWASHTDYEPGDVVTESGSAWHCNAKTRSRPGDGSADWQLAVKRGKDGR